MTEKERVRAGAAGTGWQGGGGSIPARDVMSGAVMAVMAATQRPTVPAPTARAAVAADGGGRRGSAGALDEPPARRSTGIGHCRAHNPPPDRP